MAKIKVSQTTINDIKKMGMKQALKLAGINSKATQAGAVAEYQEGVRRMYGDRRFQQATKSSSGNVPTADASRSSSYSGPTMFNGAGRAPLVSAKKLVPTGSNFMSTAPIAPKPAAKPKAKDTTKVTAAAKKAVKSAAAWRY